MLEESHHLELAKDTFGTDQTLEHIRQLLERNPLSVPGICDGPHDTEGTIANWAIWLIIRIRTYIVGSKHYEL